MIAKGYTAYDLFTIDRSEEYRYVEVEGGVKVIGYFGERDYIEIPETLDGKTVVAIGLDSKVYSRSLHLTLLLPNTVTYIEPKSMMRGYSWYAEMFLKEDNPYFLIENGCLYSKDKKTLYFYFKEDEEDLVVPEYVEHIGDYAFLGQNFESVTFPNGLKSIGSHAFDSVYTTLEIPETVEKIGDYITESYILQGDNKHYKIIDGCVYTSDEKTLIQCIEENISQVIIPDTVEIIRPYAFSAYRINKLELGSGVKEIGDCAFAKAEIKTIRIPKQLERLSETAFGYNKCNSVRIDKGNSHFYSDKICLFSVDENGEKRLLKCFKNKEEEYEISEGVTSIAPYAFGECDVMKQLTLPESLQSFAESCLLYRGYSYGGKSCGVKKIVIPANVTNLNISFRQYDFEIAEGNPTYYMEDGILYHKIGENLEIVAAKDVSGELILKNGVVEIKRAAFCYCNKITKIVCNAELKKIGSYAFSDGSNENKIEEIVLNEGLVHIDYLAFYGNRAKTVTIPASLSYICMSAFHESKFLTFEVSPENAWYTSIAGVLYSKDMKELKYVPKSKVFKKFEIPSSVVEIGRAFYNCKKVTEIIVPEQVTCIGNESLYCNAKHIYFKGNIKAFHYTGVDYLKKVTLHTENDSGVVEYVEWLKCLRNDTEFCLVINGFENILALTNEFEIMPNDTGLTIVKVLKEKKVLTIPEKIGDYTVTKIANGAFISSSFGKNTDIIEEIVIPNTVKEIGENAFKYRKKLKNVVLPKGLKRITKAMFSYCSALEEIIIPEGVEEVCVGAFFGCENINRITFPTSITKISKFFLADENGEYRDLFLNDDTLYVVEQGSYAERFLKEYKPNNYSCQSLNVVYKNQISSSITEDEKEALKYLEYIMNEDGTISVSFKRYVEGPSDIRIPSTIYGLQVCSVNLENLGSMYASVETIYIPEGVLDMNVRCSYPETMKGIEVAEENTRYWSDGKALYTKDKTILIHMFDYQTENYEVCASTKVIAGSAFAQCTNLKKLLLPKDLQEIQNVREYYSGTFDGCFNLEEIVGLEYVPIVAEGVLAGTPYYNNKSVLISGSILQKCNIVNEVSYTIPEGITEIAAKAFYNTDKEDILETIIMPSSVQIIGRSAFAGREKLKTVNIPEGVQRMEKNTFDRCISLEKLYIPASVSEIAIDVFPVCEFDWRGMIISNPVFSAIEVDIDNNSYKSIDGALYSKDGKTLILVPANFREEEFVVPETVEVIGEQAFAYHQFVKKVVLPNSVHMISDKAFYRCSNLENINLEYIEVIGKYAFWECSNLENVDLQQIKEIKGAAFSRCTKLESIYLEHIEVIEKATFSECSNLNTIYLKQVKEIEDNAFYGCGFTQVNLPDTLIEVGAGAFSGCELQSVVVPKTVLKVKHESFSGCKEITIYDTIDPDTKPCTEHFDDCNGHPNSEVGFMGIGAAWAMWECAANHRWIDHEIIVRSAQTDEIKYKVWMGADPKQRQYYCILTSSWGKNGTFNFKAVDDFFSKIKGVRNKIQVAINRLCYPEMLSDGQKDTYIAYLVRSSKDLVTFCIDKNDMETLLICEPFGILKKNNIDALLDYAIDKKNVQFSAYLMAYKNEHFGASSSKENNLSLSLDVKVESPWVVSKSSSNKVGRYKGTEIDIEFPSELKGKNMTGVAGTTSKVPENYKNIVSVVLPEGYTTIGDYAFYGCEKLEKIELPSTLETIGKDAFCGCAKLKEIIMPDTVTEIGPNAFRNCSALSKLRLSRKMTTIPGYAFAGCDALNEIDLPRNITYLEKGSLESYGIKKVRIHCPKLKTTGKCFEYPEIYAYDGAIKGTYGVTKDEIQPLYVIDMAADTIITIWVRQGEEERTYSFALAETLATIQKTEFSKEKVNELKTGENILELLKTVYGKAFVEEENEKQASMFLQEFSEDVSAFTITEEKNNEDGSVITIFTCDYQKKEAGMSYTENINGKNKKKSRLLLELKL